MGILNYYKSYFGKRLEQAILKKYGTRKNHKFAEDVGVDPALVSKWISGKDFPKIDRFEKIYKNLDVNEEYFTRLPENNEKTQLIIEFITIMQSLTPSEIRALLSHANDFIDMRTSDKSKKSSTIK